LRNGQILHFLHGSFSRRARGGVLRDAKDRGGKDVGNGSYTIAYSVPTAVLDAKRQDKAAAAAVGKAGDFCHAKNMKIMVTGTGNNVVMFRCVGN
jgi:hypothetical protein